MKELEKILSNYVITTGNHGSLRAYIADQIREAYEAGLNADKRISVYDRRFLQEGVDMLCTENFECYSVGWYADYVFYTDKLINVTHCQYLPSAPKV